MGQRSIRFPDELEARIEAVAKRDDRSFSYVVIRTMERALESALGEGPQAGAAPVDRGEGSRRAQAASTSSVSSRAPVEKEPSAAIAETSTSPHMVSGSRRETGARGAAPSRPAFKCPIARCEFTAKSPAAKCGAHGRTVVPV